VDLGNAASTSRDSIEPEKLVCFLCVCVTVSPLVTPYFLKSSKKYF
jgi:hypothetical protein